MKAPKIEGTTNTINILIVDQCELYAESLRRLLLDTRYRARSVRRWHLPAINACLEEHRWDLVICDYQLEKFTASDVIDLMRKRGHSDTPVIVVSDPVDAKTALQSLRDGAADFIFKDDLNPLLQVIDHQMESAESSRQRSRAENELKATNQKLELTLQSLATTQNQLITAERFRAHGQISSGIAHHFNNALTNMLGTIELLKQNQEVNSQPLVAQLEGQIKDAASVIRSLCELYRKNPANAETVLEVTHALEKTLERNQHLCSRHGEIEMIVRSEPDTFIWGDAKQLGKALNHLVANACDVMRDSGGTLELISRRVNNTVQIEIRDNGPGMTDSVQKRCLEPLFTTKRATGTGLGLSIVEGIIQSFGGTCEVSSQLGEGTSVSLNLRCANQSHPPTTSTPSKKQKPRKLKVLVVDDEPAINTMIERGLQYFGHETQSKLNPIEALELFESENFDLVVSDRSMPEMSGDTFALELRERHPDTRFVMVSGYGDLMLANGELPEGVDIVLAKPTPPDRLNEVMLSLFPEGDELAVAL